MKRHYRMFIQSEKNKGNAGNLYFSIKSANLIVYLISNAIN